MRSIVLGTGVAVALALTLIVPSIHGVSTWKYILAAIGLMLFFLAERDGSAKT